MGFTVYSPRQCSNLVSGCENTNQNGGISITVPSETINTLTRLISGRAALKMEETALKDQQTSNTKWCCDINTKVTNRYPNTNHSHTKDVTDMSLAQ